MRAWALTSVMVAALALAACGEEEAKAPEASPAEVEQAAAPVAAGKADALQEADVWGVLRVEWGQNFDPKKDVTLLRADVTCDGAEDYVASRVNLDNPEGIFFDVLVVSRAGGELKQGAFSLPFGEGEYSLMQGEGANQPPKVSVELWDNAAVKESVGQPVCTAAILVEDGMTDGVRAFWNPAAKAEDERVVLFRN